MIDVSRGDVVLVAFPFIAGHEMQRKRRPALVVQADRYNRRRDAVIIAAVTSTLGHRELPSKVVVGKNTLEGRRAGLRLDGVIDCQTLATISREEIVTRLGQCSPKVMRRIDLALADALGLRPS